MKRAAQRLETSLLLTTFLIVISWLSNTVRAQLHTGGDTRGEIQHGIGGEERYRHIILSKASSGGRSYLYHTFQAQGVQTSRTRGRLCTVKEKDIKQGANERNYGRLVGKGSPGDEGL